MQKTLTEIFNEEMASISDQQLIENASHELSQLCATGCKSFTMRVPANVKDTDMIFGELIKRFKLLTQK